MWSERLRVRNATQLAPSVILALAAGCTIYVVSLLPVPKHPIDTFFTVPCSDYYQLMNNIIAAALNGQLHLASIVTICLTHCLHPFAAVCTTHMCHIYVPCSFSLSWVNWSVIAVTKCLPCSTSTYAAPLEGPAYSYQEFHLLHLYSIIHKPLVPSWGTPLWSLWCPEKPGLLRHAVPYPSVKDTHCQRVGMFQSPCQSRLYSHNTLPQITLPKPGYWLKSSWSTLAKEPKLLPPPYAHVVINDIKTSLDSANFGKCGTTVGIYIM